MNRSSITHVTHHKRQLAKDGVGILPVWEISEHEGPASKRGVASVDGRVDDLLMGRWIRCAREEDRSPSVRKREREGGRHHSEQQIESRNRKHVDGILGIKSSSFSIHNDGIHRQLTALSSGTI